MNERPLAAALFATASALFWCGAYLFLRDLPLVLSMGLAATVAAALVAAAMAPCLAADVGAEEGALTGPLRGASAGLLVTITTYPIGAFFFALGASAVIVAGSGGDVFDAVKIVVALTLGGSVYALIYFSPALAFGAVAGVVFYRVRQRMGDVPR